MRISDRKKFTWRVKRPALFILVALSFYVGVFANIFFSGFPITLFVAMIPLAGAIAIIDTIKKGDY
jgi:hypothetical protein